MRSQQCLHCHAIRGEGGKAAPDLGRGIAHQYTPAVLASVMWNHAPTMWAAMEAQGIPRPQLTERDAADLFAYFYSVRFFEQPGEAERGKRLFAARHCAECHALPGTTRTVAKPVSEWQAISDPIVLVQQMWNHSALMKQALEAHKFGWVALSPQDLTDLFVYLRNLPQMARVTTGFWLPDSQVGGELFREKGCDLCHRDALALERKLSNQTLTGVAAAMWNHAPRMPTAPMFTADEMRQIVAFVWQKQYLGMSGAAHRGKRVFEKKHCATCHNDPKSGAPQMLRGERVYEAPTMVAVLWKHGPQMLEEMKKKQIAWPHLAPSDLADVVAYLNTRP